MARRSQIPEAIEIGEVEEVNPSFVWLNGTLTARSIIYSYHSLILSQHCANDMGKKYMQRMNNPPKPPIPRGIIA